MKRLNNLFDKICTLDNFRDGYYNAIKGKSKYKEVQLMQLSPEFYYTSFLEEVKSKQYEVSEYEIFSRVTGGKERIIYKLPMKDRVVQHAIMLYLEPWFRKLFIYDTYSSIKGRGIHLGLARVKLQIKHYEYCLKIDIKKFYPSIDKEILKQKLEHKIKDYRLLDLLYKIIDSCDLGVPIGNYTSLYFANYYLTAFDKWIKQEKRIKAYFRYCDDIVIFGNNKYELHKLLDEIRIELNKIHLSIKSNWQIFPIEDRGIDFLGYIIRKDYVLIRKRIKKAFIKSKVKITYYGYLKHGDCTKLWNKYTKDIPYTFEVGNKINNIYEHPPDTALLWRKSNIISMKLQWKNFYYKTLSLKIIKTYLKYALVNHIKIFKRRKSDFKVVLIAV